MNTHDDVYVACRRRLTGYARRVGGACFSASAAGPMSSSSALAIEEVVDFAALTQASAARDVDIAMAVAHLGDVARYGAVEFEHALPRRITAFREKAKPARAASMRASIGSEGAHSSASRCPSAFHSNRIFCRRICRG
ncbi:hypothetical protein [Pararobbsia silviterrae]|uniref:Uncharacterized protein n=1 Tax=Pararobbsia silviterrae TaxID=1792498 RepID=A0A494XG85_9BURK|nr:hypothetical protein [Pararobbsia silviterrae]RKP47094.1 hypothetical protein D7S86_23370 [Pararobbsia silviterrae]